MAAAVAETKAVKETQAEVSERRGQAGGAGMLRREGADAGAGTEGRCGA